MGRTPCCDKATVKKGQWSPDEDAKLKSYIEQHGTGGSWIALPQKIGLKRCGKSCRLRWLNYLRPNIRHGGFSQEEDDIICSLYVSIGSRWSMMASQLPGRTDNDIKNYWNTRLKKKLFGKQPKEPPHSRLRTSACHQKQEAKGDDNGDWRQQPALVYPTDHCMGASYGGHLVVPSSTLQEAKGDDNGDWRQQPALVYPTDHCMGASYGGHLVVSSSTLQEAKGDDNGDWRQQPALVYPTDHCMGTSYGSSTLPRQQICDDYDGDLNGLAWSSLLGTPGGQALQDPNGFSTELDEVLGLNQVNLEESIATAESEKMNWNEVSPLLCSGPVIKGCEGMQQYLLQEQMACNYDLI
ncbi:hypothetical protein OPV22_004394 [Ensete ventricosum]|uniref:Uncharacterized protein n=1 Tax=Ensete ventricosum TaxID=4639 RepID=A0AAV8S3B1_ENSVE|nr:hypothetical protein OPV22_004394 [Ensete ventricosum]